MELRDGATAVVTGGGSGIGLALADRFASAGMNLVLADVDEQALASAADQVSAAGVEVLSSVTDVSKAEEVEALADASIERFGSVSVVCNNAGVTSTADSWTGPIEAWNWVMGVNFWGVLYGIRSFLPHLAADGGHFVNTASMAGLWPGFAPGYDASKHAVVAITEGLYHDMKQAGLPVGVSVLCPGWVRTGILDAERNWPEELGDLPEERVGIEVFRKYVGRAIDEGSTPAEMADAVAGAVEADRFWVLPHPDFVEFAVERWHSIAEGADPSPPENMPGLPPRSEMVAEVIEGLSAES